jgi:mycothiol synthase
MALDADFDCRPLHPGQVQAHADLIASIMTADGDTDIMTADDLLEDFSDPHLDFEHGSLACYDGDLMVGYATIMRRSSADPVHELHQWGGVHPAYRGRGIGTGLLDWAEKSAVRLHLEHFPAQPASLGCYVLTSNTSAIELFAARGYEQSRWFHEMSRDLKADVPPRELPADVEVTAFTAERSADALLVRNESFHDHWGSTEVTQESWAFRIAGRSFRSGLSFIAYSHGEPIGIVMSHEYDGYNEKTGFRDAHINLVGTRRSARGRGIASALVTMTLRAAQAEGYDSSSLSVDAESPTGAIGIYERLGFAGVLTRVNVTRPLYEPDQP